MNKTIHHDSSQARARVLVVDDEESVRRTVERVLLLNDVEVVTAASAREALEALDGSTFDVVLTDITMPQMDGISLLREIRTRDLDLPVILITGHPTVETAKEAVAYGAFLYLEKPFQNDELLTAVRDAAGLKRVAELKRLALALAGLDAGSAGDLAGLEANFNRTIAGLFMAYQPIVHANGSLCGHEALMRSSIPELPHPGAILDAAERLGRLEELGRRIRELAPRPVFAGETEGLLFVNLHPRDLADPTITSVAAPLATIASRCVLEVTERSSLEDLPDARQTIAELRGMGFRIAIDDLGSGYAGLNSFATLRPEFVKLDLELVRDVDKQPVKQKLVRSMTEVCHQLDIQVVAEGVETQAEYDYVITLGVDLIQGFFIGRPEAEPWKTAPMSRGGKAP